MRPRDPSRRPGGPVSACLLMLSLTACGGGGSDSPGTPAAPQLATGVFKDSNVSGLSYTSGNQSGVTGPDGSFTYEVGQTVTFKIGDVTLGTATGKSVITPVDLVSNGSSSTPSVENITRFLMMLDSDGDSSNGITISDNVRSRAASWSQVDFSTSDLPTATGDIVADAQSADGGSHILPSASTARTHLESTFLCAYSGGFRGTYSGGDSGRTAIMVTSDGYVIGIGASTTQPGMGFIATGTAPIDVAQNTAFVAGTTSTGASFNGNYTSPDAMSGNWSDTDLNVSGTFSATRVGGASGAVYRFTGAYASDSASPAPDAGLYTIDIDAENHVTGNIYSVIGDQLLAITGSLSGTTLTASTSTGVNVTGTLDTAGGTLSGTWTGGQNGAFGAFAGTGCGLN